MKMLMIVAVFLINQYVIGAADLPEPPSETPWVVVMLKGIINNFPEINAYFAAAMIFIMSFLRLLAEFLGFIASKTANKEDDALAAMVSKFSRWASSIVGWFGLGSPKK